MRVGALGIYELLVVFFVYLVPVVLILWFVVTTVQHRRQVERSLQSIAENLERLNNPQP